MRRHAVRDAVSLPIACVAMLLTFAGDAQEYTFTRFAGPVGGAGSIDANGENARFNGPSAILAVPDGSPYVPGSFYVADTRANTIRRIAPTKDVTTVAGLAGHYGSFSGVGFEGTMSQPVALALDASGNLYVADAGASVIKRINAVGAVTIFAGRPHETGSTNGGPAVARFNRPTGLAFDASGNLYVADQTNHMIRKVTPGGTVQWFAGAPGAEGYANGTGTNARFRRPTALAFGPDGTLYVADTGNHVIRKIDSFGTVSLLAGDPGVPGDDNGSTIFANFNSPEGLAVDAAGLIYVADTGNNLIRTVTNSGSVSTFAGTGVYGNANGFTSGARFAAPSGITVASHGVYVTDRGTHVIRRIADDFVANYAGAPSAAGFTNGSSANARFELPTGVATDALANVYVADWANYAIRMVAPDGSVSTPAGDGLPGYVNGTASGARFRGPTALTVHGTDVYIAEKSLGHTIRKLDTSSDLVSTVAGTDESPGDEDGPAGTARFDEPSDAATDAAGNIYVSDSDNHTIRKIATDGTVSTFAGLAGSPGTAEGTGSSARFNEPYAVARVGSNLFVADRGNHAIRKVTLPGGTVTTFAGVAGASGHTDGTGAAAGFDHPEGIAADASGNLYVSEPGAMRVRTITPARVVTTIGGRTQRPAAEEGTGSVARFVRPAGIDVDTSGNIYVADMEAHRIWKGAPAHAANATIDAATGPLFVPRQLGSSAAATTYQWSIIRRPDGSSATLSNPSDDNPTFTPDVPDRYTFRLDAATGSSRSITVVDFDAQCTTNVDTETLPRPVVGQAYSQTLGASGGTPPYTFGARGYMPPGLAISSSGVISGTPTTRGATGVTFVAMDANGCEGTRSFNIDVSPLPPPSALVATAGTGGVMLSWNGVATAAGYEVIRMSQADGETIFATPDTPWTDPSPPAGRVLLYTVRALDGDGFPSAGSNPDIATTIAFTDPSLTAAPLTIKADHIEELRLAVSDARALAFLEYFPWTDPGALAGTTVRAVHLAQLREALNSARVALGLPALSFTDPSLPGAPVKKIHLAQLRAGVQ